MAYVFLEFRFGLVRKIANNLVFAIETKLGKHITSKVVNMVYLIEKKIICPLASQYHENAFRWNTHWIKFPPEFFKVNTNNSFIHSWRCNLWRSHRNHHDHLVKNFLGNLQENTSIALLCGIFFDCQMIYKWSNHEVDSCYPLETGSQLTG